MTGLEGEQDGAVEIYFAEVDLELARAGYTRAVELLAAEDRDVANLLEKAAPLRAQVPGLPRERRKWMRTDDVRERANAGVERRTKAVSVFPSVESLVGLVAAVCLDQSDALPYAQNLMDVRSLRKGYESPGLPAAGEGAVGRAPTLVGVAFMDKLGKVA